MHPNVMCEYTPADKRKLLQQRCRWKDKIPRTRNRPGMTCTLLLQVQLKTCFMIQLEFLNMHVCGVN